MPQRIHADIRTYAYSIWTTGQHSFFAGDDQVAHMSLFLDNGARLFLYFHEEASDPRTPVYRDVGGIMQGHVLVPASRLEPIVDLVRNESAGVDFEVDDEAIVKFRVTSGSEPAGEGENPR